MTSNRSIRPVRIGLIADEPIRLEGLISIFDQPAHKGQAPLIPVTGAIEELLANSDIQYLVIDLNASSKGLETIDLVRRERPAVLQIVIGQQGNDELAMEAIVAGVRAYLDLSAGPDTVRRAIDVVTSGAIWAPRRLLSKLIDRLLAAPYAALSNAASHLTAREREVLDLILMARSNREIACQLGIEERTVKAHVFNLLRKTGSDNRIELSMRALSGSMLAQYPFNKQPDRASSLLRVTSR